MSQLIKILRIYLAEKVLGWSFRLFPDSEEKEIMADLLIEYIHQSRDVYYLRNLEVDDNPNRIQEIRTEQITCDLTLN